VLRTIDLRGAAAAGLSRTQLAGVLPRAVLDVEAALDAVRPICADVRRRGAAAVREYTARFDGVDLPSTGSRRPRSPPRSTRWPERCGPR
jgi:histidinol dehydrogenase